MSLLFAPHQTVAPPVEPPPVEPPQTRSRSWYQLLFTKAQPRTRRLAADEAAQIIALNWDRTYRDIKANGTRG